MIDLQTFAMSAIRQIYVDEINILNASHTNHLGASSRLCFHIFNGRCVKFYAPTTRLPDTRPGNRRGSMAADCWDVQNRPGPDL